MVKKALVLSIFLMHLGTNTFSQVSNERLRKGFDLKAGIGTYGLAVGFQYNFSKNLVAEFNFRNALWLWNVADAQWRFDLSPAQKDGWHHELGVALVGARLYELYDADTPGFYDDLYGVGASYHIRKAHFGIELMVYYPSDLPYDYFYPASLHFYWYFL